MERLSTIRIYSILKALPEMADVTLTYIGLEGNRLEAVDEAGNKHMLGVVVLPNIVIEATPTVPTQEACNVSKTNVLATLLKGADGITPDMNGFYDKMEVDAILELKVDKVDGKGLSTNDYTTTEKDKLAGIATGAEVNVQGDWNESNTRSDAYIKNKPTIPSAVTESTVSSWGFTKNIGTYVKPSGGIPKSDLSSDVQRTLGKADTALQSHQDLSGKQDKLVSGSNIKTINGQSLLGSGNITIEGGGDVEIANFANDLTGVIEATPEEFTYRPSAGNKSIRDESAVIKRIKGNTIIWNQLSGKTSSLTYDGDVTLAPTFSSTTWGAVSAPISVVSGHTYLFLITALNNNFSATDNYTLLNDAHRAYINTPTFISANDDGSWRWTMRYTSATNGLRLQTQAFDLTRLFGAGNEPTTIEEFKSRFPDSYYPYSEPEVRNVITNQITTIGFNQWDEKWELGGLNYQTGQTTDDDTKGRSVNYFDVLPSTAYYCHTIANTTTNASGVKGAVNIVWYDSNRTFIKYQVFTNTILTSPSNARYAKICSYGGDVNAIFNGGVNINLSHSKVRNGEYEPYVKHVRQLPEIYKYFPDGMNGNANVWDELNAEYAIKRWGVVDLGSIDDYAYTGSAFRSSFLKSKMSSVATLGDYNENMICKLYDNDRWSKSPYKIQFTVNNGYLWINNPDYTDIDSFKAAMNGVLLYYELAEPIETPITEAIQLDYVVDDFGTEKALPLAGSAPFRADIVYQFNAEGRIRDNSRNIERIENTITDRLIPSSSANLGLQNKVMTWDGSKAMISLPIAESIEEWELAESPLGVIPTGKQVKDYVAANASTAESSPLFRLHTWDYSNLILVPSNEVTMLTIPEGATGDIVAFLSNTDNNMVLGKDNEWVLRVAVPSTGVTLDIAPLSDGMSIRWAYGETPTWKAGKIYECSFRLIGDTFLGVWAEF